MTRDGGGAECLCPFPTSVHGGAAISYPRFSTLYKSPHKHLKTFLHCFIPISGVVTQKNPLVKILLGVFRGGVSLQMVTKEKKTLNNKVF